MTREQIRLTVDLCITRAMALQVRATAYTQENLQRAMMDQFPAWDSGAFSSIADELNRISGELTALSTVLKRQIEGETDGSQR